MDSAEIKSFVENINKGVTELRSEVEAIKEGNKDVVTQEKWDRISNDVAGMAEKLNVIEAEKKRPAPTDKEMKSGLSAQLADFLSKGVTPDGGAADNREVEFKAMSTDVLPDGGYLVMPSMSQTRVGRDFERSPLRQVANVEVTFSNEHVLVIDDDEAAARWIGEGASGGETDTPVVGRKTIALHKLEADPRMTIEQAQDGSLLDPESWLAGKVSDKFDRAEGTAFVNGTGVGQPKGFLQYDAAADADAYERDKIGQVNLGSASSLNADGLISLQGKLKEIYQPGAVWGMKRSTFASALQLKGADNYFFSPVLIRDGQAQMQLLGKPVVFMDDMPEVAEDALSVVYADFSRAYTIVDRTSLTVLRDPYTNKGFVTYYTTKRVGGDVTSFDAIKIGKVAA